MKRAIVIFLMAGLAVSTLPAKADDDGRSRLVNACAAAAQAQMPEAPIQIVSVQDFSALIPPTVRVVRKAPIEGLLNSTVSCRFQSADPPAVLTQFCWAGACVEPHSASAAMPGLDELNLALKQAGF